MSEPDPIYLPRAEEAWIPEAKLRDYSLNTQHAEGYHKARVFKSALGLEQADWTYLRDQILTEVGRHPLTRITREPPDVIRYEVVVPIIGRNGLIRDVITGWIVEADQPPRLTSAYVSARKTR
jgi:hypothetical protein